MSSLIERLIVVAVLLCIVLSAQMILQGQQRLPASGNPTAPQLTPQEVLRLIIRGRKITSEEAESLEKTLVRDPRDLAARFTLIAYYTTGHDKSFRRQKRDHVLWIIRNVPDSELLHHVVYLRLKQFEEGFGEAKQLWLQQLDAYKGNLVVLGNAIDFFLTTDKALAERLTKQGAAAEPNEPRWPRQLGALYLLQVYTAAGETRRGLAALANQQYEQAFKLTKDDMGKRGLLVELAKSAFEAGQVEQAQTWAAELLNQGIAKGQDWFPGDEVHQGHITLGRIALLAGNIPEAKQHLIEAGRTQGSPVLNSFGPNMMLAKELLEKGERETVILYFHLCANFWTNHTKLDSWTTTVKAGGIPDFGANLAY